MLNAKQEGQVFTPDIIVDHMLEMVEYYEDNIYTKKIMEPSFGDGAFLTAIIRKIIEEVKEPEKIRTIIQNNVFGIEKDEDLYKIAIQKITSILESNGILNVNLEKNLICGDTLIEHKRFLDTFDIVIGNPPYVRVHNILNRNVLQDFSFSGGNTDLYILFYECGLKMLNDTGKICFITPNSFLKNTSQQKFRNYLIQNNYIQDIFDFKDTKVFKNADTYTCICILTKEGTDFVSYYECKSLSERQMLFEFTPIEWNLFEKMYKDCPWKLSLNLDNLTFLKNNQGLLIKMKDISCVQNGIATLRDNIFIGYAWENKEQTIPYTGKHTDQDRIVYFNNNPIESQILHRCVKASTFKGNITNLYVIYPYENSISFTEDYLSNTFPYAFQYLLNQKTELLKRDVEKNSDWFLFGRSQGLKNMSDKKVIFNHIINKNNPQIQAWILDNDIIVYSGLFITGNDLNNIKLVLESSDFSRYCLLSGKDMSGGYVAVSSKNVKNFGIK